MDKMVRLKDLEDDLREAVLAKYAEGYSSFEANAEFEIRPGLGIKITAYLVEDKNEAYVTFIGRPISYEDESMTEYWMEECPPSITDLKDLVIDIFEIYDLKKIYGRPEILVRKPVLLHSTSLEESTKKVSKRKGLKEDQITRKQKEKLNLLNDIVNFAYEYGENETKTLFKQAFKRVTGDDLVDSLSEEN